MAKTLTQVITEVRARLDEDAKGTDGADGQWSNVDLRNWTNEAVRDIATRIRYWRLYDTITAVVDTQEYDLPDDCLEVHAVRYARTGETAERDLEYRDYRNIATETYTGVASASGTPCYYWTWGFPGTSTFQLNVWPIPTVAGTFTVHYYGVPAELSTTGTDDGDDVPVLMGYERLVVDYVTYNALLADRDPRWTDVKALYEQNLESLAALAVRFVDQPGKVSIGRGMLDPYYDEWGW